MPMNTTTSNQPRPRAKRRSPLRSGHSALVQIANTVRSRRVVSRLTQEDVALISGVGVRFIIDLEHAKPSLEIAKVLDVLTALGLSLQICEKVALR